MESAEQRRIWEHFQNNRHDAFAASKPRLNFLLRLISMRVREVPRILNIGIGDGFLEKRALSLGWEVCAVDPDERTTASLRVCGIDAKTGVAEALPFGDESVDFVVASEVLEHVDSLPAALTEIRRVLKVGGFFLGTVPHNENLSEQQAVCPCCEHVFHRWGHQRAFTMEQVSEMLRPLEIHEVGREAFVDLFGRGPRGFVKALARRILGKLGEPAAAPSIWWIAFKRSALPPR